MAEAAADLHLVVAVEAVQDLHSVAEAVVEVADPSAVAEVEAAADRLVVEAVAVQEEDKNL